MKKILFVAFVAIATSFASCGKQYNSNVGSDSTSVDTTVVDSIDTVGVDTIVK